MNARALNRLFAAPPIGSASPLAVDHVAGWHAGAQGLSPLVQAQRFELIDANGIVRGVLDLADSRPNLTSMDQSGQVRVSLDEMIEGTCEIQLKDAGGAVRFGVGTTPREVGFVGLNVRYGNRAIRSRLFASDDESRRVSRCRIRSPGSAQRWL